MYCFHVVCRLSPKSLTWLIIALFFGMLTELQAQSAHQYLRKGDRQYGLDNYKAAEKHYRTAADLNYADPKALYNLGNTLYQQGRWADAGERFDQAAKYSANKNDMADALHNLGNALLKQRKYKEAIDAYENSLRLRPGDADSKVNLQIAKKKYQKEQEEQQKQQNQQQNQKDQKDQQDQQNQPNNQNQQQNQKQQNQQEKLENQQQGEQQQQPKDASKMRKEDAQRLLETAVGPEDQKNAQKYRAVQQQSKPKSNKKDW